MLLILTAGALNCAVSEPAPRDGVSLHVSHGSDDPHRLLMALNMATMMADTHDVLV